MECINCKQEMVLQKKGKELHKVKYPQTGKYKVQKYVCPDCGYTETEYGTSGLDAMKLEKYESIKDEMKDRLGNDKGYKEDTAIQF